MPQCNRRARQREIKQLIGSLKKEKKKKVNHLVHQKINSSSKRRAHGKKYPLPPEAVCCPLLFSRSAPYAALPMLFTLNPSSPIGRLEPRSSSAKTVQVALPRTWRRRYKLAHFLFLSPSRWSPVNNLSCLARLTGTVSLWSACTLLQGSKATTANVMDTNTRF